MNDLPSSTEDLILEFRSALAYCRNLYLEAGRECARSQTVNIKGEPQDYVVMMDDLRRGLVVKIFVEIAQCDWEWSRAERHLALVLVEEVWGTRPSREELRQTLGHMVEQAGQLSWASLVGPFAKVPHLRERAADLETAVTRIGNVIAKIDGQANPDEVKRLTWIQSELRRLLVPLTVAEVDPDQQSTRGPYAARRLEQDAKQVRAELADGGKTAASGNPVGNASGVNGSVPPPPPPDTSRPSREAELASAMEELQALVGLEKLKADIRELVNFLKVQEQRASMGLPKTNVMLHMVFAGNPGTGKTTVARILGRLLGGMGILAKGHLIETDRSGLVAEYAGQTGPKTNKCIDEALDGVLFIDEAYSLVARRGDDPYGAEAVQTLLKRMEDDRDRLVVVLAGYPKPMERLLRANPGLTSRFNRRLDFPDYAAAEIGRILQTMCDKNQYELPATTRLKLLAGFQYLLNHRDAHFGNGRVARNVFENAIRRLANRITGVAPLTHELLTTIEPDDVAIEGVPLNQWTELEQQKPRVFVVCPGCQQTARFAGQHLGRQVRCKRCSHEFMADWGELIAAG